MWLGGEFFKEQNQDDENIHTWMNINFSELEL